MRMIDGSMTIGDVTAVPWVLAVDSDNTRTVEASVSADLAVHTVLEGAEPRHVVRIQHGGTVPDLSRMKVNLYVGGAGRGTAVERLADLIRQAYGAGFRGAEATAREFQPMLA